MSYCSCGLDIGDPRLTDHLKSCASRKVMDLEERIAELEAVIHDVCAVMEEEYLRGLLVDVLEEQSE